MRYGRSLLEVEKPGRYEGLEAGSVRKEWHSVRLRVALCFPDVYEIGMSHLGLPILYHILNEREDFLAERAYAPWMDMEALLRRKGWPLVTRESGRALGEFDLVGFTLPYELVATNVLAMLDLGRISLLAKDRGDEEPLVVGGGPVASNPEPLADFFDAFLIGDGEEAVTDIAEALAGASGETRARRLSALAEVPGVYLPSRIHPRFEGGHFRGFESPVRVRRRIVPDLEKAPVPSTPLIPFIATVHERMAVELARGCTRGCRFCQAGVLYRPVRERNPDQVRKVVAEGLQATGLEEVGLLSLSTGDYSSIGPLLVSLMDAHAGQRVSVSLPSLRVDSLESRLLEEVRRVRKTGFTVAPEAGTERLRRVINKNVDEAEILRAAEKIFEAGWKGVKLYFMIGLPTETREDWEGIVALSRKVARLAPGGRGRVGVSLSNFVPKSHTPFQWARQLGPEEVGEAQAYFKDELREKRVDLKWHDARMSTLEGVFARGDRRLGQVVLAAYRRGARMDGWTGEFRWNLWSEALAEADLNPQMFLRERDPGEPLPWDGVDVGVDRTYLLAEWQAAQSVRPTADCRNGECQGCGLCDFEAVLPRVAGPRDYPACAVREEEERDPGAAPRLRFRFSKTGPASLLSHLETVSALHRGFRAAGFPLVYSRGYHPHPKLNLGAALPLGTESHCELGEVRVWELPPLETTRQKLNEKLPEGLRVEALWLLAAESKGLTGGGTWEEYRVSPTEAAREAADRHGGWEAALESFWSSPTFPVVKRRKSKPDRVLDAREFVDALWCEGTDLVLRLTRRVDGTMLGPEDLVRQLVGLPEGTRSCERTVKCRMQFL